MIYFLELPFHKASRHYPINSTRCMTYFWALPFHKARTYCPINSTRYMTCFRALPFHEARLIELRPSSVSAWKQLMYGWSQIKVHTDEQTQVHSAQPSLAVTHPSTNQAQCYLTSMTKSPSKHWSPPRKQEDIGQSTVQDAWYISQHCHFISQEHTAQSTVQDSWHVSYHRHFKKRANIAQS